MSTSPEPPPTDPVNASPRTPPPSIRFWESKRNNFGAILTLLAAVFTLGVFFWPITIPQGRGTLGVAWGLGAVVVAAGYLAGFFLADKHWSLARTVILIAAAAHILGGLSSALIADAEELAPALLASLFDVLPAIVAIIGALLIGKPPTPREHREMHAQDRDRA